MIQLRTALPVISLSACMGIAPAAASEQDVAGLSEGVTAAWDASSAHRSTTSTRERLCINGLWRWQPADREASRVPRSGWGHFKVPGCWPGITDYMQKDCQTVFAHSSWKDEDHGGRL